MRLRKKNLPQTMIEREWNQKVRKERVSRERVGERVSARRGEGRRENQGRLCITLLAVVLKCLFAIYGPLDASVGRLYSSAFVLYAII